MMGAPKRLQKLPANVVFRDARAKENGTMMERTSPLTHAVLLAIVSTLCLGTPSPGPLQAIKVITATAIPLDRVPQGIMAADRVVLNSSQALPRPAAGR